MKVLEKNIDSNDRSSALGCHVNDSTGQNYVSTPEVLQSDSRTESIKFRFQDG